MCVLVLSNMVSKDGICSIFLRVGGLVQGLVVELKVSLFNYLLR